MENKAAFFEKGNINDLRRKLKELLQTADIVAEYKSNAQNYICNKYNWDDITKATLELYKN